MEEEQKHYILKDGSLYSFDAYDKTEVEIGFWQFIKEFRPGSDKLILARQSCDLCRPGYIDPSGLLLKRIYEALKLQLGERELEFIHACDREPDNDEENKVPASFASDEEYMDFLNKNPDSAIQQSAYLVYKKMGR